MKILLEYDPTTGNITDPTQGNMFIAIWADLEHLESIQISDVEVVKDLTRSGLSVKDILELRKGKMI